MKPIKATIIEFVNDNNEWQWYKITRQQTPIQAIKEYLREMGLNTKQKINDTVEGFYATEDDVRAYNVEIE